MCSNYEAVTSLDLLRSVFGVDEAEDAPDVVTEVWPLGLAPFIRLSKEGRRIAEQGQFGLLPVFAKEMTYGRRTYNARSETVATLPSFRSSWAKGMRCIIPAHAIYEPRYFGTVGDPGTPVRWRFQQEATVPMGIAGVFARHPTLLDKAGNPHWSFSMLTVNADGHPLFQLMHKPGDEKRMVVILAPSDYDRWLSCPVEQAPEFFRQWMGPLENFAAPLPPRIKKEPATKLPKARPKDPPPPERAPPETGDLF